MMTNRQRIVAVADLFGIPTRLMAYPRGEERESFDVHVFTESGRRFRLGYFSGNDFTRENPVMRALCRYGIKVREGEVGEGTEPQYDLRIAFNDDGTVFSISDNRASMEAEF